jgi:site-specific recombinase XerD
MTYSILAILHPHEDKQGLHKVNIQVIYQRKKAYAATVIKIPLGNWDNGTIIKHEQKTKLNGIIKFQKNEIESRLLDAIAKNKDLTKEQLTELVKGEKRSAEQLADFIYDLVDELQGKFSTGRLKHFKVIAAKVKDFAPGVKLSSITVDWLQKFEARIRATGVDGNTVQSNMNLLKGILNKANAKGLIEKKQYELYKVPLYKQKLVDFLSEEEIDKLLEVVHVTARPGHKLAGYYFLLSCLTGYRISDAKAFNYEERVKDGKLVLRAKKNGSIVSMPIHTRLQRVLDYIKDKPLYLSEQKVREYVKELCLFAGIKSHKYHASRHSFAMLLMKNGFTIDEVSELIGDSVLVGKVYARIHNETLSKKILERLG